METLSVLLVFVNPTVSGRFLTQRASEVLCYWLEPRDHEQTVELRVIWDMLTLRWRHFNDFGLEIRDAIIVHFCFKHHPEIPMRIILKSLFELCHSLTQNTCWITLDQKEMDQIRLNRFGLNNELGTSFVKCVEFRVRSAWLTDKNSIITVSSDEFRISHKYPTICWYFVLFCCCCVSERINSLAPARFEINFI